VYCYILNLYFDDYWLTTGHYICRRNEPPESVGCYFTVSAPIVAMIQNHHLIGRTLMLEFGNVVPLNKKYISY